MLRHLVVGCMLALSIGTAVARPAAALPIATWDIAGSNGQTATVLASEPFTSASTLIGFNITPWPGGFCCFTAAAGWSLAFDSTRYYEFSVSADPGHMIVYESISLSLFRGIQGATHGAESWELRSSADGFASTLASFSLAGSASDEQVLFSGVDISAVGTLPGTVFFRLYGFDYTSPTDFSGLGAQLGAGPLTGTGSNLVIGGLITPEPGTALLVATGLVALGLLRRGRR